MMLLTWKLGVLVPLLAAAMMAAEIQPVNLACEHDRDPLGIDVPAPVLSWQLDSPALGEAQSASEVLVASSAAALARDQGDVWASGKVAGADPQTAYAGAPLATGQRVFWKVRVWDRADAASPWSTPAQWTMGYVSPADCRAHWITEKALLAYERPLLGFHSQPTQVAETTKWLQVDLGAVQPISLVRLHALRFGGLTEGHGFPLRFKVEASNTAGFAHPAMIADYTREDYPNWWAVDVDLPVQAVHGRYVRLTATKLRVEDGHACLALSHLEVVGAGNVLSEGKRVTASDSQETAPWSAAAVVDHLGAPGAIPNANGTLLFRRDFAVRPQLVRAILFISGLGDYNATINGEPIDDDVLAPGWTNAAKTCLYDTRDVTALVRAGTNVIGIGVAGGMYNVQPGRYAKFVTPFRPPAALAELRLQYADGRTDVVTTDASWRVTPGATDVASVYGGEEFDARRAATGWDHAGFRAVGWAHAHVIAGPGGVLRGHSHAAPPVRRGEPLREVGRHTLPSGAVVHDFGQNAALMLRLRVHGPRGARVRVTPSELLNPDGTIDPGSGGGRAWWEYALAGTGDETWVPAYFYHGARYLQVECLPAVAGGPLPVVDRLEALVTGSSAPAVGEFSCSNDLMNRIHQLILWAQRSNSFSVLTDCPHRERLGWLEQLHLNGPALRYNTDLTRLFNKSLSDMRDAQQPDGLVPDIAPEYIQLPGGFRDSPEWGSAALLVPWQQYLWTGDASVLRTNYDLMRRYVAYLSAKAHDHLLDYGLGDWYDIGPKPPGPAQLTPVALTATAFYYQDARILTDTAVVLGNRADAERYGGLADEIRTAFNAAFFDAAHGRYATGSQCANAIPLAMDLVADADRPAVMRALVDSVTAAGTAVTAGDVGYRYVLRALADAGRSDLVYAINNQSTKPGYGYQLAQGATSLTEAWDANRASSQNHFMLGQLDEWFYHDLAGIQPDPTGPGFRRIIIRPAVVGDLTYAKASYISVRGLIRSEWHRDGMNIRFDVEIPTGSNALVFVPAASREAVALDANAERVARFLQVTHSAAVFAVPAGTYSFTTRTP